jgi:hypothetical protein
MFFVAFAVFLSAAIYISPIFCGSNTEKKMISKPQEIDTGKNTRAATVQSDKLDHGHRWLSVTANLILIIYCSENMFS